MDEYKFSAPQVTLMLACIEDRRDIVLRKIDHIRKGKLAIDESLYEYIIEGHQAELYLLHETTLTLKG